MPPAATRLTVAVIGNGPLGASTARALLTSAAASRLDVTLFDSAGALWSSHDDHGRLTRVVDYERQPEWVAWNRSSLAAWRGLERDSGQSFFTACGSAILADLGALSDLLATQLSEDESVRMVEPASSLLPAGVLGCEADGVPSAAVLEERAGYVNPVKLVAAQNAVFAARGGTIVRDAVSSLRDLPEVDGGGVAVHAASGGEGRYDCAVLCAGSFANALLLRSEGLGGPLPYAVSRRTVLLGRVSDSTRRELLAGMPVLKVLCEAPEGAAAAAASFASARDASEAESVYILPPIFYPELGGYFVKASRRRHVSSAKSATLTRATLSPPLSREARRRSERLHRLSPGAALCGDRGVAHSGGASGAGDLLARHGAQGAAGGGVRRVADEELRDDVVRRRAAVPGAEGARRRQRAVRRQRAGQGSDGVVRDWRRGRCNSAQGFAGDHNVNLANT